VTRVVCAVKDRSLTADSWGDPAGAPIVLLHGTPGSRRGPRPRSSILYRLGVRLISYDRPGYGESTRFAGRSVADAADDVAAITEAFGITEFSVVGRSGGGPHALACAALLPDRVRSVAVLVGLAPSDAKDLGWYDGMTQSNVRDYSAAADIESLSEFAEHARRVKADPEVLLHSLRPDLTGPDRRVVDDITIRNQLTETYTEALRDGTDGWIDDVLALRKPWGFDLTAIKQPLLLWHGAEDSFSPVTHAIWLAEQIPTAVIEVAPGTSHFGAVETLPKALAWVKEASLKMAEDSGCASAGALHVVP
jgi:pimeloyl-ACP methyl ester carboxylesterase